MVHAKRATLAARLKATQEEVYSTHPILSRVLPIILWSQWCASLGGLGLLSWFTRPWITGSVCIVISGIIAACQMGIRAPFKCPASLAFDMEVSRFGLRPEPNFDRNRCPASMRLWWWSVQAISGAVLFLYISESEKSDQNSFGFYVRKEICRKEWKPMPPTSSQAECDYAGVPPYIPCSLIVTAEFKVCLDSSRWFFSGICTMLPAWCTDLGAKATTWLDHIWKPLFLLVLVAPLLATTLAWFFHVVACVSGNLSSPNMNEHSRLQRINRRALELDEDPATRWSQILTAGELVLFMFDFIGDFWNVFILFWTKNYAFAAVTSVVFLRGLYRVVTQLGRTVKVEVVSSVRRGLMTDMLYTVLQAEKLHEAPVNCMMQYLSFMYVTFSSVALYTFPISLLLCTRHICKGVYECAHLGIDAYEEVFGESVGGSFGGTGSNHVRSFVAAKTLVDMTHEESDMSGVGTEMSSPFKNEAWPARASG